MKKENDENISIIFTEVKKQEKKIQVLKKINPENELTMQLIYVFVSHIMLKKTLAHLNFFLTHMRLHKKT